MVAQDGKLLAEVKDIEFDIEKRNSMHVKPLTVDDFRIKAPIENGSVKVNLMKYNDFLLSNTIKTVEELPVKDGEILHTLQLSLAGLISLKPAEELAIDNAQMKEANRALGLVDMENPLLRIVTLALPVIPEVKMSDLGLIDVLTKSIIPTFIK